MVQINSLWDFISAMVLVCAYYGIYKAFTGDFEIIISYFLTLMVERNTKRMTSQLYPFIFKRPDNACDCSLLNTGGPVGNRGGFPSGHMAITSYFMNYLYFNNEDFSNKSTMIYLIPSILMGSARYMKECHNIYQILAGYLLGFLVAYWGYNLKRKYNTDSILKLNTKPIVKCE